jgi:DNA-binding IclR family transcriptional regulator
MAASRPRLRQDPGYSLPLEVWLDRMRQYAAGGYALDLEENGDHIRCVAAPIRDVTGAICGALSVATAAQYMDDRRVQDLIPEVKATADTISRELGYAPQPGRAGARPSARPRV